MFEFINNIWLAILFLVLGSYIVSKASDKLGDVLHVLGLKLHIPTSVRGATFDAISSSFPEFTTAMIAVLFYQSFEDIGVPTIAGSGIFNILLIPMASIIAFKGSELRIKVQKQGVLRDMIFYTVSILAIIIFLMTGQFTPITGLILLFIYVLYIIVLYRETIAFRKKVESTAVEDIEKQELKEFLEEEEEEDIDLTMSYGSIILWIAISIGFIWVSIDAVIQSANVISDTFSIPKYIVSVIILAACTSIPDTLLSVKSARMGDAEGAVANAVGSNIFDICICLGLPMIIAGQNLKVSFNQNIGILGFVLLSMLTTATLLLKKKGVTKKDSFIMLGVYFIFLIYVVLQAIG